MIHPTSLIHISIRKPIEEIYNFISNPRNMSEWAAGLSGSPLTPDGDQWLADSPMGKVKIKFAPKNDFGIADHDVTLPNGQVVHNPLRVQKNGDGAEVIFTLYRLPGVSEKDFQADAAKVRADLAKLKALLESDSRG
ncbi:SRPBCC family protein [Oleiharenicola lentus]|uniref:SRPBCC family protein n=1 Tax=Oleiharenicola lentus TaxID=2508720 RepID=UPI003F66FED2